MNDQSRLDLYIKLVEDALERYIPNTPVAQGRLIDAMHYSLFAGGKRIRPVLLLEFCRIAGGEIERALPFACSLEMIHTYSLIHDDLPAMDDDTQRRGRPCNHKVFGEATAILAGDALLTAAFETMLDADNLEGIDPTAALSAAHTIAWASGAYGMAGGQQLDLDFEGVPQDFHTASLVHSMKTGALFCAAAEAGCLLGGADKSLINYAISYANYLGLVFQIQDDILNVTGDQELLGKSVGTDVLNEKLTFVKVLGLSRCKELVEELTQTSLMYLEPFSDTGFLIWLTERLAHRKQ